MHAASDTHTQSRAMMNGGKLVSTFTYSHSMARSTPPPLDTYKQTIIQTSTKVLNERYSRAICTQSRNIEDQCKDVAVKEEYTRLTLALSARMEHLSRQEET